MTKTPRRRVGLGGWPALTRFYGISPFELARMPHWLTRLYAEKLPEIEARETMRGTTISAFPHTIDRDRDRMIRDLVRQSGYEPVAATPIDPTTDEGRVALAGMGIGVTIDSPVVENDG